MTNTKEQRRQAVHTLFDSIAPRYDLLNHLLSTGQDRRWRRKAVACFSPGRKLVLDLAAGTGDLGGTLLGSSPGTRVIAADFVAAMCSRCDGKLRDQKGFAGCVRADAMALPFADNSFDGVMSAFGVRNFADLPVALKEIDRVLKPGGELLVLEFFPAQHPLLGRLFRLYFHGILPVVGGLISGSREAYTYLPESVDEFLDRDSFASLLASHSFEKTGFLELSGGIATAVHARKPGPVA
jgi:demethylmenaquinone methyltransferase / 2-methoxy-6-polyprenyl-1,4-benzoquinol methylase